MMKDCKISQKNTGMADRAGKTPQNLLCGVNRPYYLKIAMFLTSRNFDKMKE
jgi:hypothetical protein